MYDLFFLSYDEPLADRHWEILLDHAPHARRVSGISGIQAAHARCAEKARTSHFFVVDADNEVVDPAPFSYSIPTWDRGYVHLWFAHNPVNGLEYGWGGIKLFPKALFAGLPPMRLDMTTGFPLKIVPQVCSITRFDVSPFEAWRSSFRECVKLAVNASTEAQDWLGVWCGRAEGLYAEECLRGAQEGRRYGSEHATDPKALQQINDYGWLRARFTGT